MKNPDQLDLLDQFKAAEERSEPGKKPEKPEQPAMPPAATPPAGISQEEAYWRKVSPEDYDPKLQALADKWLPKIIETINNPKKPEEIETQPRPDKQALKEAPKRIIDHKTAQYKDNDD